MAVRNLPPAAACADPVALARRLERAEAEQLACTGAPGFAGALAIAGGLAVSKGPRSASSAAFGLGLAGPVSAPDLDRIEAHLGAVGGDVRIELCAHADPSLGVELARRGYRLDRFLQVLVRPVSLGRPPVRGGARLVHPGEERAWADTFSLAHLGSAPASDEEAEDLLAIPRTAGNACFAAFDGEALAAVALVSAHDGVAELSGAGVLPAFRGRGLHLGLVNARLAWAAAQGCDLAASAVEPGGASQRNLEKVGFRVAYPKVVMVRGG